MAAIVTRTGRFAKMIVGLITFLGVGLVGGTAYAYFTSTAHGSGAASVGHVSGLTLMAASGSASSNLSPGGAADLVVTLNNPNSFPVTIVGTAPNGNAVVHAAGIGVCTNTGVTAAALSGLNVSVGTGSSVTVHIANGAAMSTSSDSGCQGATFEVPVTLTVEK